MRKRRRRHKRGPSGQLLKFRLPAERPTWDHITVLENVKRMFGFDLEQCGND
jgi:hypothetical protein